MASDTAREVAAVREWYERTATSFDGRYAGRDAEFWDLFEERIALECLAPIDGAVLDLGCGAGRLSASLSGRARTVLGADIAVAMLAIAEARCAWKNVRYAALDATAAGIRDSDVDAVISLGMFEYLDDPSPFLREIFRVLRPGGRLVFTCHNRAPLMMRAWMYGEARLRQLFASGHETVRRHGAPRVARHRPAKVLSLLHQHGFVEADFRGFYFAPAVDLFRVASHLPRPLQNGLTSVSVAFDRAVGGARISRRLSSLSMYTARKPR